LARIGQILFCVLQIVKEQYRTNKNYYTLILSNDNTLIENNPMIFKSDFTMSMGIVHHKKYLSEISHFWEW